MELSGTIKALPEIQTFASGFQKRELVLLTDEQYPQPINIEFLSDKIDLLDTVAVGDMVKIGINIRGREWVSPQGETKYFNSITGWRVEKVSGTEPAPSQVRQPYQRSAQPVAAPQPVQAVQPVQGTLIDEDEDDDLPF